jgi:hypothetical protein
VLLARASANAESALIFTVLARLGATFTSTFTTPDVGWIWPVAVVAPALLVLLASVLAGVVVVGVVLGVLVTPLDGVIDEGVVVDGVMLDGVVIEGVALDGVVGSAMLPFDEFVVTPLFFDVSVCVVLGVVELGWVVVCCAAAGTASAVMNTAAIVYR